MKENKVFATLSGIGIILVVSAHVDGVLNLFNNFFPYNSFFMPLFVFISGYFFKDKNVETLNDVKKYIFKKIKNLLLYYLVWNLIYGVVRIILYNLKLDNYIVAINWKTLFISPFIDGQQFGINAPAWFIPALFTVEMAFLVIRKMQILIKQNSEYITLFITMIISIIMVYIAENVEYNLMWLPFIKLGFFIFFFQLGKIYKDKFEEKEIRIKNMYVIIITLIINLICIAKYKNINFASLYNMGGFRNIPPYIPIITSITGIWFWLRIARIITPVLSESKIFTDISNNTKAIMMHHIFCMLVINIVLYYSRGLLNLEGFDVYNFKNSSMWYRYYGNCNQLGIIYVIIGIYGPLKIEQLERKVKKLTNKYIEDFKSRNTKRITFRRNNVKTDEI